MTAVFDVQGLDALQRNMTLAGTPSKRQAAEVVKKAAVNIKNQMQDEARGAGYAGARLARTINFDVKSDGGGITAEVGPVKGGPGTKKKSGPAGLLLLYFGNSKSGPQIPDPMGALDHEIPSLKSYLQKLIDL